MAGHLAFDLRPLAPFRLDLTVWTLRRRLDNGVDRWDGRTYRRVLMSEENEPFEIAVSQTGPPDSPVLNVSVSGNTLDRGIQEQAASMLARMLGIHLDLGKFYDWIEGDGDLQALANRFRGFKPPRFPTYFETLVNAISCQQVSLTLGIRLLNRLVECCGPVLRSGEGVFHAFPRPQDLAEMDIEGFRNMGFSRQKARYITGLARLILENQFHPEELEALEDHEAVDRLCALKGVGRWTAEYFLLRGLGRTHIFPADDVGARNHLQRWLGLSSPLNYQEIHRVLEPWEGFGGLVYFHLLLKSLEENGVLAG